MCILGLLALSALAPSNWRILFSHFSSPPSPLAQCGKQIFTLTLNAKLVEKMSSRNIWEKIVRVKFSNFHTCASLARRRLLSESLQIYMVFKYSHYIFHTIFYFPRCISTIINTFHHYYCLNVSLFTKCKSMLNMTFVSIRLARKKDLQFATKSHWVYLFIFI